jgi:hypothetical protein
MQVQHSPISLMAELASCSTAAFISCAGTMGDSKTQFVPFPIKPHHRCLPQIHTHTHTHTHTSARACVCVCVCKHDQKRAAYQVSASRDSALPPCRSPPCVTPAPLQWGRGGGEWPCQACSTAAVLPKCHERHTAHIAIRAASSTHSWLLVGPAQSLAPAALWTATKCNGQSACRLSGGSWKVEDRGFSYASTGRHAFVVIVI